jgi:hypothetical protein
VRRVAADVCEERWVGTLGAALGTSGAALVDNLLNPVDGNIAKDGSLVARIEGAVEKGEGGGRGGGGLR